MKYVPSYLCRHDSKHEGTPIPYTTNSHSYGLGEIIITSLGMWWVGGCLGNITFVKNVRDIQYGYPVFGCKGANNSFYLDT